MPRRRRHLIYGLTLNGGQEAKAPSAGRGGGFSAHMVLMTKSANVGGIRREDLPEVLLTRAEAAECLGLSVKKLANLACLGRVRSVSASHVGACAASGQRSRSGPW
jgi:hypothetical protein